ncbi:MAG TPA: DinB family protein [Gemmatimonadaceae bacterium]|nr:DinB family protein [Gemmatimonadaceae bacterium]
MRSLRSASLAAAFFALPLGSVAAQSRIPDAPAAGAIRQQFLSDLDSLQSKFVALATAIPEDKYAWRPGAGVRSIGEAFMHVASEYYTFAPVAFTAPRSTVVGRGREGFQKFEQMSTKADVLKHLNEGFAYAKQNIGALAADSLAGQRKIFGGDRTIIETSFAVAGDLHEHLGQLIAYARMNGITPPWSK